MDAAQRVLAEAGVTIPIDYRALGLGRAKTIATAKNSAMEKTQRSALLIFVARMMSDTTNFDVTRTLTTLIENVDQLTRVHLSDYEYARLVAARISPILVEPDAVTEPWLFPTQTPEEAAETAKP